MDEKRFCVVSLPDEEECPYIVSSSWLQKGKSSEEYTCLWPPYKGDTRIKRAVLEDDKPISTWQPCTAKLIKKCRSYKGAENILNAILEISNQRSLKLQERKQSTKLHNRLQSSSDESSLIRIKTEINTPSSSPVSCESFPTNSSSENSTVSPLPVVDNILSPEDLIQSLSSPVCREKTAPSALNSNHALPSAAHNGSVVNSPPQKSVRHSNPVIECIHESTSDFIKDSYSIYASAEDKINSIEKTLKVVQRLVEKNSDMLQKLHKEKSGYQSTNQQNLSVDALETLENLNTRSNHDKEISNLSSNSTGFAVVHFLQTDEISVVSQNWLVSKNTCKYPLTTSSLEKKIALLEHKAPETMWHEYPVVIVGNKFYSNYLEAKMKAKLALKTSNSDTDGSEIDEGIVGTKTQKRLSSSDLECRPTKKCRSSRSNPSPPIIPENSATSIGYPYEQYPETSSKAAHAAPECTVLITESETQNFTVPTDSMALDKLDMALAKAVPIAVENHITKMLKGMKSDLTPQGMVLRQLSSVENNIQGLQSPSLPITNSDELARWELHLEDESRFKQTVEYFSGQVGSDFARSTRRLLRELLTNEFAHEFNWAGRGSKTAFKNLKIAKSLICAVRCNANTSHIPLEDIEEVIKVWLKTSRHRKNSQI